MRTHIHNVMILISLLYSAASYSSSCQEITNQINSDINKYANSIQSHKLDWMNLSWLENHLGKVKPIKKENGRLEYRWQCMENADAFLTTVFDNTNHLVELNSNYSSELNITDSNIETITTSIHFTNT